MIDLKMRSLRRFELIEVNCVVQIPSGSHPMNLVWYSKGSTSCAYGIRDWVTSAL